MKIMKYIRTKDAIIDISNLKIDTKYNCYVDEQDIFQYPLNKYREADNIEELCDKYYGVDENGEVCRVYNWSKDAYPPKPHEWAVDGFCTKEDITISELKNQFPKGIFGAIVWFDSEGNLHIDIVAKMNEKGKLELL